MTLTRTSAPERSKSTDERYTPPWIIERAQPIGLDPCAPVHNPTGARVYHTKETNGLVQDWSILRPGECVWVNPPYSTGQNAIWSGKIIDEFDLRGAGPIYVLTSGDFTTQWWPCYFSTANACVLLKDRVPYIYPGESKPRPGSNFGNIIWGYTHDTAAFFERFGDLGYPLRLR